MKTKIATTLEDLRSMDTQGRVQYIHLRNYLKSDKTRGDYVLKPMTYPDLLTAVLGTPIETFLTSFKLRHLEFGEEQVKEVLARLSEANKDYVASNKADRYDAMGFCMFHDRGTEFITLRNVVVISPIKAHPDIQQALHFAAVGGTIANFVLRPGGFDEVVFEYEDS